MPTKYAVFTVNVTDEARAAESEEVQRRELLKVWENLRVSNMTIYLIGQMERGAENHRLHVQGAAVFDQSRKWAIFERMAMRGVMKTVVGISFREAEGSFDQIKVYHTKDATRVQALTPKGEWPEGDEPLNPKSKRGRQGKRTDYDDARAAIENGMPREEFLFAFPEIFARSVHWVDSAYLVHARKEHAPPHVEIHFGTPGTGKTHYAYNGDRDVTYFANLQKGRPFSFSGYDPVKHTTVVLDDYSRNNKLDAGLLLRIMDGYPVTVEGKNTTMPFLAKRIYITSNWPPNSWYNDSEVDQRALFGRIKECWTYTETPDGVVIKVPWTLPVRKKPARVIELAQPLAWTEMASTFPATGRINYLECMQTAGAIPTDLTQLPAASSAPILQASSASRSAASAGDGHTTTTDGSRLQASSSASTACASSSSSTTATPATEIIGMTEVTDAQLPWDLSDDNVYNFLMGE